jgi:hypothetical protein
MEGKVTVIAYRRTKPGKERALREVLLAVRGPTLAEKGCINYDLPESPDAPRGSRLSRELEVEGRISTRTSPLRISPPSAPKPRSCSLSPPTSRCGAKSKGINGRQMLSSLPCKVEGRGRGLTSRLQPLLGGNPRPTPRKSRGTRRRSASRQLQSGSRARSPRHFSASPHRHRSPARRQLARAASQAQPYAPPPAR